MRNKIANYLERLKPGGIQSTIMVAFSIISVSIMLLTGIVMYMRFSNLSRQEMIKSTQKLMEQSKESHGRLSDEYENKFPMQLIIV